MTDYRAEIITDAVLAYLAGSERPSGDPYPLPSRDRLLAVVRWALLNIEHHKPNHSHN